MGTMDLRVPGREAERWRDLRPGEVPVERRES